MVLIRGSALSSEIGDSMTKLFIWIGVFVDGWLGWFLGDLMGFEFLGSFMTSSLGSIIGVFIGWRIADHYF